MSKQENKERPVKFVNDNAKRLHDFLRKIASHITQREFYKNLTEEQKAKIKFPHTDLYSFKYEIDDYLWQTFPNYGNNEIKVMHIKSNDFKADGKNDTFGFLMFCMSVTPEPKQEIVKETKEEKPISMDEIADLFNDSTE